jgi:hypothetical protein
MNWKNPPFVSASCIARSHFYLNLNGYPFYCEIYCIVKVEWVILSLVIVWTCFVFRLYYSFYSWGSETDLVRTLLFGLQKMVFNYFLLLLSFFPYFFRREEGLHLWTRNYSKFKRMICCNNFRSTRNLK